MFKLFADKYTGKKYLVPTNYTRTTVYQYPAGCKVWEIDGSSDCSKNDIGFVCFKTRSNLNAWVQMMGFNQV